MEKSNSTGFQRLDPEETSFTEDQLSEIPQQIESKISEKVMDETQKTEDTILKAPRSLSENSLYDDIASMSAETAPEEEVANPEHIESRGPESEQKTLLP